MKDKAKQESLLWPAMLLTGSLTNVAGMAVAISNGDGDNSVAFKTGMFASLIFGSGHVVKIGQILHDRYMQEEEKPEPTELESVTLHKWTDKVTDKRAAQESHTVIINM